MGSAPPRGGDPPGPAGVSIPAASRPILRSTLLVSLAVHLVAALVPGSWWTEVGLVGGGGVAGRPDAGGARGATFLVLPYEANSEPALEAAPGAPVPSPGEPAQSPDTPDVTSRLATAAADAIPLDPPETLQAPDPTASPTSRSEPLPLPEPVPVIPPADRAEDPAEEPSGSPQPGEGAVPRPRGDEAGASSRGAPAPGEGVGSESTDPGRYRPPRMLVGQLPLTPEEAVRLNAPEELGVRLRIDTAGNVDRVEFVDPQPGEELAEAVRRSAMAMRFVPARRGSRPVEAWFAMTFVFRN